MAHGRAVVLQLECGPAVEFLHPQGLHPSCPDSLRQGVDDEGHRVVNPLRERVEECGHRFAPAGDVGGEQAVDEHHHCARRAGGALLRPRERGAVGVRGVGCREHVHVRGFRARRPPDQVVRILVPAQPVDGRRRGELGGAQSVDEVTAHRFAAFLKTRQGLVGQGEPAEDVLGHHGPAGDHPVAVQQRLPQRHRATRRVGVRLRRERPAADHVGRGERGKAGAARAHPASRRPPLRPVRRLPASQACPDRGERVWRQQPSLHQIPHGLPELLGGRCRLEQILEQEPAAAAHLFHHLGLGERQQRLVHLWHELRGVVGGQQQDPRVASAGLARADDADFTAGRELVEHDGRVIPHAGGQDVRFPGGRGQPHTG